LLLLLFIVFVMASKGAAIIVVTITKVTNTLICTATINN
jgi:hypothetical protein